MRRLLVPGLVLATLVLAAVTAASAELKQFFGSYVGRAKEVDRDGKAPAERDIDLVIAPDGANGLALTWTNVTLVDGRRDVPGVKRRADEVRLAPVPDRQLYLARAPYDPFTEARPANLAAGDPLRWATLSGNDLRVYSLIVEDDGRYELQTYTRSLTPGGIALKWHRLVEGEVVRRMEGHTVRAD